MNGPYVAEKLYVIVKSPRRIKRPPSQCVGIKMAVVISVVVMEFYIPEVRSPGGKIPPKPHLSE